MIDSDLTEKKIVCVKCGMEMTVKIGKYGKFLSCSGYPDCKTTRPLGLGIDCPEDDCPGELVKRKSKKGRTLYGCSLYPECDFILWDKPVNKSCPACEKPYMVEKMIWMPTIVCSDNKCSDKSEELI